MGRKKRRGLGQYLKGIGSISFPASERDLEVPDERPSVRLWHISTANCEGIMQPELLAWRINKDGSYEAMTRGYGPPYVIVTSRAQLFETRRECLATILTQLDEQEERHRGFLAFQRREIQEELTEADAGIRTEEESREHGERWLERLHDSLERLDRTELSLIHHVGTVEDLRRALATYPDQAPLWVGGRGRSPCPLVAVRQASEEGVVLYFRE